MNAIPTIYKNLRFRSRLEATWACFFDQIEWSWEYEPIDLKGYIPDFILPFEAGPLLVEVKPALNLQDLYEHTSKIERSGWQHDALIVRAGNFGPDEVASAYPVIGIMRIKNLFRLLASQPEYTNWESAVLCECRLCKRISLGANTQKMWPCVHCGKQNLNEHFIFPAKMNLLKLWNTAKNKTQWKGGGPSGE